jgi:uncharacterized membrane-anchored protein
MSALFSKSRSVASHKTWSFRVMTYAISTLVVLALAVAVQVKPANAGGKWVLPAIAGVVVGAAIADHAYKHHRYKKRYHNRYHAYSPRKRYYKRYHRRHHYHGGPVLVIPFPFIGFHH